MNTQRIASEITVGARAADITGQDDKAVQSAIDLAESRKISRVRLKKGIYTCKNSIMLKSGIELSGEGTLTVIRREPPKATLLIHSVNHYESAVAVKNPGLFKVGSGITIIGSGVTKKRVSVRATVIAKKGKTLFLDKPYLGENFWIETAPAQAHSLAPLIYGENLQNLLIKDMQIDGNISSGRKSAYACGHGIYLKNCRQVVIRNAFVHNNNGDGIGFEISHGVTVENCLVENNAMSIHAGSGSLKMHVLNNTIRKNRHGFYFCWGIQQGVLEGNEITDNDTYGVSVGFHDSNNIIRRNIIANNSETGILFRAVLYPGQSPCGDTVEGNLIENNGPAHGAVGIQINCDADDIKIAGNKFRENRKGSNSTAVFIGKNAKKILIENNDIKGFIKDIVDCRPKKKRKKAS